MKTCRICGQNLTSVLKLGTIALSVFPESPTEKVPAYPLELGRCPACGLVQLLGMVVPPWELYHQYWYESGVNQSMREALREIAQSSLQHVSLGTGDVILDIGANDGTLLSFFPKRVRRIAFEPAQNLQLKLAAVADSPVMDFFAQEKFLQAAKGKRAKLITSIAMLYDLDDPIRFIQDVAACLAPDGVWINQMSTVGDMIEHDDFMTICHEHRTYFSLKVFEMILKQIGLILIDAVRNDVNGGSLRTVVAHRGVKVSPTGQRRIQKIRRWEEKLALNQVGTYATFAARVQKRAAAIKHQIQTVVKGGKTIAVLGASTKGNTLLHYCHLDHKLIRQAIDRNPAKTGKYFSDTGIRIVSESEVQSGPANYLLVLPWHFRAELLKRQKKFLHTGGKIIFPLPKLEIIEK